MEQLRAQLSALENEVKTLKGRQQMNWLKRGIEKFMASLPDENFDYTSPFGAFGIMGGLM